MMKFLLGSVIALHAFASIREPMLDFISGDAFRNIADYIYEKKETYDTDKSDPRREGIENCGPGDILFVTTHCLEEFFLKVHPKIQNPYILISHNSDNGVDESYASFIQDEKIIKWFAQNVDFEHEKLVPIPIGIENRYWYRMRTRDSNLIKNLQKEQIYRRNFTYLNISLFTFKKEREFVVDFFQKQPFVRSYHGRAYSDYLRDLKKHRFCLSPSGTGIDTHRTWEALLMGSIPIVRPFIKKKMKPAKGNAFLFTDLPVIIVDDWSEVTPNFLYKKELEFRGRKFNYNKLYFPFWRNLILGEVENFKRKEVALFDAALLTEG